MVLNKRLPRPKSAGGEQNQEITFPATTRRGVLFSLLITAVLGGILYYLLLPALSFQCADLYIYIGFCLLIYFVCRIVFSGFYTPQRRAKDFAGFLIRRCRPSAVIFILLLMAMLVGFAVSNVVVRAQDYYELMEVTQGDFIADVDQLSYNEIPLLDEPVAEALGDRKLGELSDIVSQFEIADGYTQINFNGRPVRLTSLTYGDLFKWFNNRSSGLPGYVVVDMVTQEASIVRLEDGMKYSPYEHFGRNLTRYLRFNYPTFLFDSPHLEVDDDGHPYWICPRMVMTIGVFGGKDARGAVLVDAVTGECTYYEQVPIWVDQVYSTELILQQYEYHGRYIGGFLNSMIGQQGVTVTTDGSNFIALNDDVYLYTGITSAGNDASNVGFILCNQRTRETTFYPIAGATESSAMESAQGVVQHLGYTATFPLLLNIKNQPTYIMALKDSAMLVKLYAMVNVQQYQVVATGATLEECEGAYGELLSQNNLDTVSELQVYDGLEEEELICGVVEEIRTTVKGGDSWYYIRLEGGSVYYAATSEQCEMSVMLNPGDAVVIHALPGQGEVRLMTDLERNMEAS